MLSVKNLSFAYKPGEKILDDISFDAPEGRLIAVLGPNGAGKSTLFKCILGFMNKFDGEIYLGDKEIRQMTRKEIANMAAYIPQSETPVFNYTAFDAVLMGTTGMLSALQRPGKEQEEIARKAIDYLGISYLSEKGINEISGGERQLVFLARAMAQQAKILIMDEPTANLDYGNQQHVLNHVQNMTKEGYTILLSTHNPEHALQYATHILSIKDHKILAEGEADEVLNEDLIEKIYGLKVTIIETEVDGKMVRSCVPATVRNTRY